MSSKIAAILGVHPKGLSCALGGFILCLSFASDFSYPNLNTYITSYMRTTGYNPTLTYADFVFLSTTKTVVQGVSMPFIGDVARKIGCRPSIAIGSAIYRFICLSPYFSCLFQHWVHDDQYYCSILVSPCHHIPVMSWYWILFCLRHRYWCGSKVVSSAPQRAGWQHCSVRIWVWLPLLGSYPDCFC